MRLILLAAALPMLAACTWVPMTEGAASVQVLSAGPAPANCEKRGEVEVSVQDRVVFYERNELRVREEREPRAGNGALGWEADGVQPLAAPRDGKRRFAAWRCHAPR